MILIETLRESCSRPQSKRTFRNRATSSQFVNLLLSYTQSEQRGQGPPYHGGCAVVRSALEDIRSRKQKTLGGGTVGSNCSKLYLLWFLPKYFIFLGSYLPCCRSAVRHRPDGLHKIVLALLSISTFEVDHFGFI